MSADKWRRWIAATLAAPHRAANALAEITLMAARGAHSSSTAFSGTRPAPSSALHRPDAHAVLKEDGGGAIRDGVEGHDETGVEPRAVRILERTPRQAGRAGTRRDRAERAQARARRHVHSGIRPARR